MVKQREPLNPIVTTAPFQMVSLHFLHAEASLGGYSYILVVMDRFTRYAQAYATKDKSAKTAAEMVYNDFSVLESLKQFTVIKAVYLRTNSFTTSINFLETTPYHPSGNGQVECFKRIFFSMIRTLPEKHKARWRDHLNKVVHELHEERLDGLRPIFPTIWKPSASPY